MKIEGDIVLANADEGKRRVFDSPLIMRRLSHRGRGRYRNRGRISFGFIDTDTDPDPDADGPLSIIRIAAFRLPYVAAAAKLCRT
jgi:hypothetical protein